MFSLNNQDIEEDPEASLLHRSSTKHDKNSRGLVIMEDQVGTSKSLLKRSRCLIAVIWAIAFGCIGAVMLLAPEEDQRAEESSFLMSTIIASVAATLTILVKYAAPDKFGWQAYLVHGATFMFSFVMLGFLATDLAFTLNHRQQNNTEAQTQFNSTMNICWIVVYWGNLIFGTFVNKFFQVYWVGGHFSVSSRIKFTLRKLLIQIVLCTLLVTVLIIVGFIWLKD
jgi:fatty acid desaturase